MSETFDTDVLVAGAGPTGLTMASQLAARGVKVRLIDKNAARSDKSRALVVQARTLELLHRYDLAEPLIARGQRTSEVHAFVEGREKVHATFGDIGIEDTLFPYVLFISQVETEHVLEGYLEGLGVKAERPVELASFAQDASGVSAVLQREGREERVRCRYLVGCDGAHSAVRKGAGLSFDGAAYPEDFTLADVDVIWDQPRALRFFLGMAGMLVMAPLSPAPRYRLIVSRAEVEASTDAPTLEEIRAHAAKVIPFSFKLENPHWLTRFHLHHRGVDRYRHGRAFVAGDAAHIHSPAGGQGMNTGIQDAINLSWKLAHAVQKGGGEALLDSYHAERHPVGQALLHGTDRIFAMTTTRNKLVLAARDVLAGPIMNTVLHQPRLRAKAFRFISQLGIRYSESPVVAEHGSFEGGPTPGARAPDVDLEPGRLSDRLKGPGHHLLALGPAAESIAAKLSTTASAGAKVHALPSPRAAKAYGLRGSGTCWVRPDSYVGFRGEGEDPAPLLRQLQTVLG